MLTAADLAQCRQVAEAAMWDRLYITGPSTKATNPATGQVETVPGPVKYGTASEPGVGLVQMIGQAGQLEQIIGGQVVTVSAYAVKIPANSVGFDPDDEVHVVTSHDPDMAGRVLVVQEPSQGNSFAIQRRLVATLNYG